MYADDTSITYAGKDLNDIDDYLNKDLRSVNIWLSANKLTLNLIKTEFLTITSRQRRVYLSAYPSLTILGGGHFLARKINANPECMIVEIGIQTHSNCTINKIVHNFHIS